MSALADSTALLGAIAILRAAMPRAEVVLRVTAREKVLTGVADGDLAIGLVDGVAVTGDPLPLHDTGPFTSTVLTERPVAITMPQGHPLSGHDGLHLTELADAHWIDAPDTATPLARLRAVTRTPGFHATVRYEGTDVGALLRLVAAGVGLALLPASVAAGTASVPVSAPPLTHRTELLHGTLDATGEALVGVLVER